MKAAILNIGTELLMGMTVNTNSAYLSDGLSAAGVYVYYHVVVGDNRERIIEAIHTYLPKVDLIVTTGGLGPTLDDITKEASAEALGLKMVYHEDIYEGIVERFKRFNRPLTENNKRQAYFPETALILKNPNGTAPGCIASKNGKTIIMMPGPPRELQPMFENEVMPWLSAENKTYMKSTFVKLFGIGESAAESHIMDLIEAQTNPTIAPYVKNSEVMLRVTASADAPEGLDSLLSPIVAELEKRLGNYIYALENKGLEEVVIEALKEKHMTISLAESCTGGMIAQMLTGVSGSSAVFDRSLVTYSNRAKMDVLGVKEETLETYGAVSRSTALEMVEGLFEKTKSDVCIAVTGIAGPTGGSDEKPVGTVFIAVKMKVRDDQKRCRVSDVCRIQNEKDVKPVETTHGAVCASQAGFEKKCECYGNSEDYLTFCKGYQFTGDRERIRLATAMNSLDLVRRMI